MNQKEVSCFVIGPIGDEFAPYGSAERLRFEQALETWEKVIEPACVAAGLEPIRADKIAKPGEITEQVFTLIRDADVVIADVTGGNPNVMYELGLRHTLHKCTIQIGEHGQLPFDISVIRTLKFARTPAGLVDARKNLEASVAAAVGGSFDAVTATRLWNSFVAGRQPVVAPSAPTADDEPGFLELLSEMEAAFPDLISLIVRSSKAMEMMGDLAVVATSDLAKSDAMNAGFGGRLRIANKLAADLAPVADDLEAIAEGIETRVGSIHAGMSCLLDLIEQDLSQLKNIEPLPELLQTLVANVRQANANQAALIGSLSLPGKFSKPLRISTRRIAGAVGRIAEAFTKAEVWNSRLELLAARGDEAPGSKRE